MSENIVTVQPLKQSDAGEGLAGLTEEAQEKHRVNPGDYILLRGDGGNEIVRRVWDVSGAPQDDSSSSERPDIHIDGRTRQSLNVSIGDTIEVEKTEVEPAEEMVVALPRDFDLTNIERIVRQKMQGLPVKEGSTKRFEFNFGGAMGGSSSAMTVRIVSTEPGGFVCVTDSTTVMKSDKPISQFQSTEKGMGSDVPDVTYEDIGGLNRELEKVREMIELPMRHSELFDRVGIEPPKGVLLHGPPGTGKTLMAKAVANEVNASFSSISGPEIMSRFYGESEERLRDLFEEAEDESPAVIFIDEIDAIAPSRGESGGEVEQRIVAQLLSLMDGLEDRGDIVVIGATNRVDDLDNALRRGGRFDRELEIGVPDKEGRREIFGIHTRSMPLGDGVDLDEYAEKTYGFVGSDIQSMTKEAAMCAIRRVRPDLDLEQDEIPASVLSEIDVCEEDFKKAMKETEPSAMREVFVEAPDVTWDDVGGLQSVQQKLVETVQWPLEHEDVFEKMKMNAETGVLMYGPPGTGKTLLAKAVANEADSNFISVKGPELINKYIGESEKGIREVFSKARENAPTVVFFDEIDAIATQRGMNNGGTGVTERVVSQLLTELDGLENLDDVIVLATSNRPDRIDNALLRPGRLSQQIHVPVPNKSARRKIFKVHTDDKPIGEMVDFYTLAEQTSGFVGADIEAVVREASMSASRRVIREHTIEGSDDYEGLDDATITKKDFEYALKEVTASVTDEIEEQYEEIEEQMERSEPTEESNMNTPGFQ